MTSGSAKDETIPALIHDLLDQRPEISIGDVLERSRVTRQAIQYHLKKLVERGELEPIGAGRARRYRRPLMFESTLLTEGLQEDQVWKDLRSEIAVLRELGRNAQRISNFAFTEMLNNAIDHSRSETVRITVGRHDDRIVFTIADDGIGAFENVRREAELEDHVAAIQELSKGKMTTDPKRHTGEGIFFTSKAVDSFALTSNGWTWIVDNVRQDQTINRSGVRRGTIARFEVDPSTDRDLTLVFNEYTDEETHAFNRSRTVVRLFEYDVSFVSRSEAKRVTRNLERFAEVVVDFRGVDQVGQGFADELFRVWATDHPHTRLIPVNMDEAVSFIVERALAESAKSEL